VKRGGRWIPKSWRRLTTFALHPEATGGRAESVLQDEVPANDPGEDLAEGSRSRRCRRTPRQDERRELGIAQSDEGAPEPRKDEGQG
jgi:hypothetical protein